MKKLWVILLLCVYGFSATGATLHFHYCCGKLDKVSLQPAAKKCGGMAHRDGKKCCDEKQVSFKVKDAHSFAQAAKISFAAFTLPQSFQWEQPSEPLAVRHLEPTIFAPPPLAQSLHILYCVYRI
jgi:hypothetical protein